MGCQLLEESGCSPKHLFPGERVPLRCFRTCGIRGLHPLAKHVVANHNKSDLDFARPSICLRTCRIDGTRWMVRATSLTGSGHIDGMAVLTLCGMPWYAVLTLWRQLNF